MMRVFRYLLILSVLLVLSFGAALNAACAIANPSFEVPGTGAAVMRGWEQFGITGSTSTAVHGWPLPHLAARTTAASTSPATGSSWSPFPMSGGGSTAM